MKPCRRKCGNARGRKKPCGIRRKISTQLFTAHEEERRRIARELHDRIGQMPAATQFSLDRKISQMKKDKAPPGISLEEILAMMQNGIEETRRIMTHLSPSILDDLGIVATMSWFCREFQKVYSHVRLQKEVTLEEKEVPEYLKIVVFRVLQEATAICNSQWVVTLINT